MARNNIWRQSVNLLDKVFQVTSGLSLPRGEEGDYWQPVVAVFLSQANERLYSIRLLLDNNYEESSVILTRSIFELAVNLVYISKDSKKRLNQYLKHGVIPLTSEDVQQLQRKLAQEQPPEVKELVPGQAWRLLKDMCCDLGSRWLKEYETFYRYASVPTHAGSFTLTRNYPQLLEQKPPSDHDRAVVLFTALDFHLRVAAVAAHVFPKQIDPEVVKQMIVDCQKLGQSL
jgi:hypothetical protein